ncbi:MAG: hypothetical protein ABSB76_37850 [Streptosporangiaceae bacterium]|jgi:hypothetical protein
MQQWTIGISHGGDLTFCLYVRDSFKLAPVTAPQIPALIPPVARLEAATENLRPQLETQWTRWWADLLRAKSGGQRRKLGEAPDAFPELDGSPELFDAASKVSPEGHAWTNVRKKEFFSIFRSVQDRPLAIQNVVAEHAAVYPFNLSVTCLPVDGKYGWRIAPGHALVSYQLYADYENFLDWLGLTLSRPPAQ